MTNNPFSITNFQTRLRVVVLTLMVLSPLPLFAGAMPAPATRFEDTFWETFWSVVSDALNPKTGLGALAYGVFIGLIAWLVGRAGHLAVERFLKRHTATADQTAVRFIAQLARLLIWILAFLVYAHLVPSLNKLGTAGLTSVGVVSVVVGMAAQNTLGNLIAGVSLVL